jgi:hypothetical protein
MDKTLAIFGIIVGGIVGFLAGKSFGGRRTLRGVDIALVLTKKGTDGFVEGEVLNKKMKGKAFHWVIVGFSPAPGSRFEIRPKRDHRSILDPEIPFGVDHIAAEAKAGTPNGTRYYYELWQVLANGDARMLEDPEITVSEM